MSTGTLTTAAPAAAAPSKKGTSRVPFLEIGDIVLVRLGVGVQRPMIVSAKDLVQIADHTDPELRISGTIFCEPDDHTLQGIRESLTHNPKDPARITGRPERHLSTCYGEGLAWGMEIGQWQVKAKHMTEGR